MKIKNELRDFDLSYGKIILGVDEAGRGPLAGPVVASAVIIPKYFNELDEINDSKKLTEKKREKLFNPIMENCIVGVGIADEKEIDEINILNATFLAMRRAIEQIDKKLRINSTIIDEYSESKNKNKLIKNYDITLVDGNHKIREYNKEQEPVIKGDGMSLSIAAASIIAKVTRDRILLEIAKEFSDYKFEKHKGYGTKLHREILLEKGPCKYHRNSFLSKILGKN